MYEQMLLVCVCAVVESIFQVYYTKIQRTRKTQEPYKKKNKQLNQIKKTHGEI